MRNNEYTATPNWFKQESTDSLASVYQTNYYLTGSTSSGSGISSINLYNKYIINTYRLTVDDLFIPNTAIIAVDSELPEGLEPPEDFVSEVGNNVEATNWHTSYLISVVSGTNLIANLKANSNRYGIVFYDEYNQPISGYTPTVDELATIPVPENARYFRCCHYIEPVVESVEEPVEPTYEFYIEYKGMGNYEDSDLNTAYGGIFENFTNVHSSVPEGINTKLLSTSGLNLIFLQPLSCTVDKSNNIKIGLDKVFTDSKVLDLWTLIEDEQGNKYIITDYNVVGKGGITAYYNDDLNPGGDGGLGGGGSIVNIQIIGEGNVLSDVTLSEDKSLLTFTKSEIEELNLWKLIEDEQGNKYIVTDYNIVGRGGITAYYDGDLTPGSGGGLGGGTILDIEIKGEGNALVNVYLNEDKSILNFDRGYLMDLTTEQTSTALKTFTEGIKVGDTLIKVIDGVLTLDCSLAVTGGITAYALGEQTASSIMDAIICDGTTITVIDGKLTVIGGTGGASNWDELEGKPSWITDTKPTYAWGEITQKPTTLSGYGIHASDVLNTLKTVDGSGSGLDADLLDGYEGSMYLKGANYNYVGIRKTLSTLDKTPGSQNAWNKPTNAVLSMTNENNMFAIHLGGISNDRNANIQVGHSDYNKCSNYTGNLYLNKLGGNVYIGTTLAATINSNVASATKLQTTRTIWGQSFDGTANVTGSLTHVTDITGTGTFTGANIKATDSVYVNGIRLHKTADGVITLEGNLAVTGGITQFAVNEVNPSTIMDGVVVDGTSIKKENGVLKVMNAGGGEAGSVKWINIDGKPTTLAGYSITASDVLSTLKTVDGSGSGLDADTLDGSHRKNGKNGVPTIIKFPTFTEISPSASTDDYLNKIPGWTYNNLNTNEDDTLLLGIGHPNSRGCMLMHIYSRAGINSEGYPRYSSAIFIPSNSNPLYFGTSDYKFYSKTFAFITDNVASATKLQTPRTINGTAFNGTSNIVTNYWGTARTLSLTGNATGSVSMNGSANVSMSVNVNYATSAGNADTLDGYQGSEYLRSFWTPRPGYDANNTGFNSFVTFTYSNNAPNIGVLVDLCTNGYGVQFNTAYNRDTSLYYRRHGISTDGGIGTWQQLARVTDNVASATKLQIPRTIWGQSFDGTANVSGSLTGVTHITMSGALTVPYHEGQWISMATRPNIIQADQNQFQASAHALFRVKSYSGNAVCFGGLGDEVGFYGFYKSRIDSGSNGTDWYTKWNTSDGTLTHKGNLLVTGGGTFYSSDIRAKNVIESLKIKLNDIANAPVIKFKWNGYNDLKDDGKLHIGGVAQYIEKILPECVIGQKEDFLSFDYATVGYIFSVQTARHLQSYETKTDREIKKLKNRITFLEKQLKKLGYEEINIMVD